MFSEFMLFIEDLKPVMRPLLAKTSCWRNPNSKSVPNAPTYVPLTTSHQTLTVAGLIKSHLYRQFIFEHVHGLYHRRISL